MNYLWIKGRICEIIHSSQLRTVVYYQDIVDLFEPDLFDGVIDVLAKMYEENHICSSNGKVVFRTYGDVGGLGFLELRRMILGLVKK